jgi:hypothetical protein
MAPRPLQVSDMARETTPVPAPHAEPASAAPPTDDHPDEHEDSHREEAAVAAAAGI